MKNSLKKISTYLAENFYAEQERWIAWVPVLFGIGIGLYFLLPAEPNVWVTLGVFELVLLLFYLLRFYNLHLFFIALLIVLSGFIDIQMRTVYQRKRVSFPDENMTYLKGRVVEISYSNKGKERLLLDNAADFDKPLAGQYRVTVTGRSSGVQINECVELVATVFPPSPIQVLDGFQLDRKYFYAGISAIGYANSEIFGIDCPEGEAKSTFRSRLNAVRQQISDDIFKILPADEAGVAGAVLIGEKSRIPEKIVEQYRDSGLAHFLSVSGLHLGTIAGLVFFVLRFLTALFPQIALQTDSKKIAAVGAIFFSALYLLVSGMEIPAERAFIMTSVVFIGILFNRQAISMRMVSFAALAVLVISPSALISISFQMSFAAVVALIAFYERYSGVPAKRNIRLSFFSKVIFYLVGIVICDFVASIATMPFAVYHFHRIAAYTSLGNLLAGPLIGLVLMPLILVCLAALPFGAAGYPLMALGYGLGWLNRITAWVSGLPHSVIYIDSLPFGGFIFMVAGGCWLCLWTRPWRRWGLVLIFVGMVSAFFPQQPDMVFAADGKGIAVRDKAGALFLLPLKTDSWVKKIWQENLHLQVPTSDDKESLKNILFDGGSALEGDLVCTAEKCTYKGVVDFTTDGEIFIRQKEIDNSVGGYIYIDNGSVDFKPLWNKERKRLWQNVK